MFLYLYIFFLDLEEEMTNLNENVLTVNQRLKAGLDETRSSDKICVDIICVLILLGFIIVLVQLTQHKK